jgi:hypothetical protein
VLQNKEHIKFYKRNMFPLVIIVVILSFVSEAKAFKYGDFESGDSYDTVKNLIFQNGDYKIIDFKEDLITTEFGLKIIINFKFVNKRLCEVRTKYGPRKFTYIVGDIDGAVREYGASKKMETKGKKMGDGFKIAWEKNKQVLIYDVGKWDVVFGADTVVNTIKADLNYCN